MFTFIIKYFFKDELVHTYVHPSSLDIAGAFHTVGELRGHLIDMNLDHVETRENKLILLTVNTFDEQKISLLRVCNWDLEKANEIYLASFES